jgi:predicted glutamine amidotransferase
MCRLFGMSGGKQEVQANFWLLDAPSSLLVQSEGQPDGVGLGTFDAGGTPQIYRKPVPANRSQTFITSAHEVRSRTFLSHIRHATAGGATVENTHPFEYQGRIFAHNGVIGDLPALRRRLGSYVDLVRGATDSELFFALINKCIDERSGDIGAGIAAAANEMAANITLYSLNLILTTATDVWALRYPDTNHLYILERSISGFGGESEPEGRSLSGIGREFDERSMSGMRVRSAALSLLPATVIASERMDPTANWRLLESGELIHVDSELRVSSEIVVSSPPASMLDLSTGEAVAQAESEAAAG